MAKYQILYRESGKGVTIVDVEKIDKNTELRESGENRFDLKVQIENGLKNTIDFVYRKKLYISLSDTTELVKELIKPY